MKNRRRYLIVGLGNQGRKRSAILGESANISVDPAAPDADFHSLEQVNLELFDTAFVCTPESEKFAVVSYLLTRGKHVLVEKPLLLSDRQFNELEAIQEDSGATLYVAFNHRFEPHIVALKNLLSEGKLGRVYTASIHYGNGTALDVARSPWRDSGLGVVSDLGSHALDLVDYFWGLNGRAIQFIQGKSYENESFDFARLCLTGDPAIAVEVTLLSWKNDFHIVVRGSEGTARLNGLCKWGPSRLTIETRVRPSGAPTEVTHELVQQDNSWKSELEAFEQRIAEKNRGNLGSSRRIAGLLNLVS